MKDYTDTATTHTDYENSHSTTPPQDWAQEPKETLKKQPKRGRPTHLSQGGKRSSSKFDIFSATNHLDSGLPPDLDSVQMLCHLLKFMRKENISFATMQAALCLHTMRQEETNLTDLATSMGVTTANITSVADGLEDLGFASRNACDNDRRRIQISLTHRGEFFVSCVSKLFTSRLIPRTSAC